MFLAIIVLPNPLRPTRIRLRPSGTKSRVSARSTTSRSILLGHVHSKSAMGLNFLMPLSRNRRSRLRRERSAISACTTCSSSTRGDQRALVARARKSSSSAGRARKPICSSCPDRLFSGVIVVVVGEFIVGLQVVRANVDRLGFGVTTQIDRQGCSGLGGTLVLPQQESDRRSARRIPLQGFTDGSAQRRRPVEIQQFEQLCGLAASRLSLCEGL